MGPDRGIKALRSFMGSLDVPSVLPGWLMPSWLAPESGSPRDAARRQCLRELRKLLAAAQQLPPLVLPPALDDGCAAEEGGSSPGSLDLAHSASNAVPFHSGSPALSSLSGAAAGGACRAEEARQVLPWLFAVEGRLDFAAMEGLASQLALGGLQLLDVSRYVSASSAVSGGWHSGWGSHIRWAGRQTLPSPVVASAAALRRMEVRRGGALAQLPEVDGKAVVVTYHAQHRQVAAETLALYLHAYGGVSGQEAAAAAGHAVGATPLQDTLRQLLEELALIADGWCRRVTLAWPYGGGKVEVVGEAVGGWDQRAPMAFDVKRRRWSLQIWGLQPGIHRFKYLVDGHWVIDLAAHTEADSGGNTNNVVIVGDGKPLSSVGMLSALASSSAGKGEERSGGGGSGGASLLAASTAAAAAAAEGTEADAAAQIAAAGVLATAEPPVASAEDEAAAAAAAAAARPWSSIEEMEVLARYGAGLMALHTRLGLQLRHMLH